MPVVQASLLVPSIFIAQEPQMPSRQERRRVSVGSTVFLIHNNPSRIIGPQSSRSTKKVSIDGFLSSSGLQR